MIGVRIFIKRALLCSRHAFKDVKRSHWCHVILWSLELPVCMIGCCLSKISWHSARECRLLWKVVSGYHTISIFRFGFNLLCVLNFHLWSTHFLIVICWELCLRPSQTQRNHSCSTKVPLRKGDQNVGLYDWSHTFPTNPITETENGFMEPKCPMRFGGDERHPKVIIWEYDDWFLGPSHPTIQPYQNRGLWTPKHVGLGIDGDRWNYKSI